MRWNADILGWNMNDLLLILLVIVLAIAFGYFTRGIKGFMGRRLVGILMLITVGVLAVRCGLI